MAAFFQSNPNTMKTTLPFLMALIAIVACTPKKSEIAETSSNEWKELDSFHMIMAEAFHPYKDSANLAPAKTLAKEMSDEAGKWATATLPEKVDNDEMKTKLQKLSNDSQSFLKLSTDAAPDSVLAKSITDLHHLFHEIQEEWYSGGKENHEHH